MSKPKKQSDTVVPSEMLELVSEIQELSKVRASLNFGTQTSERNGAESLMSRRITKRVNELSRMILSHFKED